MSGFRSRADLADELVDDPVASAGVPAAEAPYLAALNPAQREAVEALEGPVLVLAGAGTGKTRVLTTRIAHLIHTGTARPWQILAVTFTNKAAKEMQGRVAGLVGPAAEGVRLGTFHSLAARILRTHAEKVGLKPNFTILDADDQLRLVKQLVRDANIDEQKFPARNLAFHFERWKDRGLAPDRVSAELDTAASYADGRAPALYAAYQQRLLALNACDFGDLLLHNLALFTAHEGVLAEYHAKLRYLLVDEYQDTNLAQYLWLRLLAQARRNLCCVGDDDQSIYGWRGAEIGNILKFERDFPGARVIRLEQNYRSTPAILAAASALIAHNRGRLGKTLWTERESGEKVQVRGVWDGEGEARLVADEIENLQHQRQKLDEIAILVRAGFQTREFEERLLTLGIPYRVVGGPRFYERLEIRDAIAYLRLVHSPDDDLAFERIVNKPKRGLGDASLQALHRAARAGSASLAATAQNADAIADLKPAARKALKELTDGLQRWRAAAATVTHVELAERVLAESGYAAMWKQDKSPEAPGRLENLKELVQAMAEFENLGGFLEHIALVMEANEAPGADRVSIMTLHSAKGLEFDTVFLPGWEEGVFPHQRALDQSGEAGLEEERRLAYVGLTRAKKRAMICHAANRRVHNQWQYSIPSRFIGELPKEQVEAMAERGLAGGRWAPGAGAWAPGAGDIPFEAGPARSGVNRDGVVRETDGSEKALVWRGWRDRAPVRLPGKPGAAPAGKGEPVEGRAVLVSTDPKAQRFRPGDRVFHQKFGTGTVKLVEGDKLTVAFDRSDTKKIVAAFVKAA
jgi:DNA helicase II / ATP-dependent DNA helicase PcrA